MYTSPLRRAIATAQIIADEALVPDLRILHGLNNVDYGAWEGMTAEEAAMFDPEAFALYRTSPNRAACPLGERLSDARDRMMDALRLIAGRHAGEAVAVVTHAVMIRLVFVQISGISDESWRRPVGRGSVTAFYGEGGTIWPAARTAGHRGGGPGLAAGRWAGRPGPREGAGMTGTPSYRSTPRPSRRTAVPGTACAPTSPGSRSGTLPSRAANTPGTMSRLSAPARNW